ncbi:MAG: hypothetical protein GAK35_02393 [Herbaspirillum frisingense]|uniref:Uncharacterized protein n=1 Tax=Herbaspirillum frisingense TaxID=92645 RepID=A0A7V8JU38_9BURK|nr:MAG: hypothetical protein GAK35_02393 [Herbaspirillum frisingense]
MLKKIYEAFEARLAALVDKSSWFLIVPALAVVACIDLPRTISVLTWMAFVAILVGFCIQISRVAWSPVDLVALLTKAREDARASAIVVAAVIHFVAILVLAVVLWTRP